MLVGIAAVVVVVAVSVVAVAAAEHCEHCYCLFFGDAPLLQLWQHSSLILFGVFWLVVFFW